MVGALSGLVYGHVAGLQELGVGTRPRRPSRRDDRAGAAAAKRDGPARTLELVAAGATGALRESGPLTPSEGEGVPGEDYFTIVIAKWMAGTW